MTKPTAATSFTRQVRKSLKGMLPVDKKIRRDEQNRMAQQRHRHTVLTLRNCLLVASAAPNSDTELMSETDPLEWELNDHSFDVDKALSESNQNSVDRFSVGTDLLHEQEIWECWRTVLNIQY